MNFDGLIGRVLRAARLDKGLYAEVEAEKSLTQQALLVVIIASLLSGIGSFLGSLIAGSGFGSALLGLVVGIAIAIVGYFIWAFIAYIVGTRLFQGTADHGELQRTLGYAFAPTALGLFSFIPCVGPLIAVVGFIWTLVCGVVAVQEALDFDLGKAVLTVLIGWIVWFVVSAIIGTIFGIGGLALSAVTGAFR
jgi:hypothetical protein